MTVSPSISDHPRSKYAWAQRGDINAFSGLMLDNIGVMILMASLLVHIFGLPREFVLTRMIPGTAVGVLVGDLIYTAMAFRLARRTGRSDITAMPLGLDTPSTFGAVLFIIGPAYQVALKRGLVPEDAARHAWFMGIAMLLASGIFKIACASMSAWIRRIVPRAGLLGSLAAIALVLISFLPLLDIAAQPVAGMVALGLMLATLTARWEFPKQFPGALGAVLVGCLIFYAMQWARMGRGGRGRGRSTVLGASCRLADAGRGVVGAGSRARGARRCDTCRSRFRWRWRRSSAASTARRAPRPPGMITRPARSSPSKGLPRSSGPSSAV